MTSKFKSHSTVTHHTSGNNFSDDLQNMRKFVEANIKMKILEQDSSVRYIPTNCYGNIDFEETTTKDLPRFIRCADDTDPRILCELFTDHWHVEQPGVLVSFTGGAKNFELDSRTKKDFLNGFSNIARKMRAWVISGGTNNGVMELLGEAFYGTTNVCVGITTWGIIANSKHLIPNEKQKCGKVFSYPLDSTQHGCILDHNHTHFVLIDDGSVGKFGREMEWRRRFEKYIIEDRHGPNVLLSMEGGPGTLGTICDATVNHRTPCVLFEGSGRVTDVLVYALKHADEILQVETEGKMHEGLINEIKRMSFNHHLSDIIKKRVVECVKNKELFIIANVRTGFGTEDAIVSAALQSTSSMYEQIRLAILWDAPEYATKQINETWIPREDNKEEFCKLYIMALALNRVAFVKLFNSLAIGLKSILTKEVLQFLYAFRFNMDHSTLQNEVKSELMMDVTIENELFFKSLLQNKSSREDIMEVQLNDIELLLYKLLMTIPETMQYRMKRKSKTREKLDGNCLFAYPFHHLFIWAVLNNMHEMSLLLWEFQDDAIAHAIMAAEISMELLESAREAHLQSETVKLLEKTQLTYQQLSIDLMDECYRADENNARALIAKPLSMSREYNGSDKDDKMLIKTRPLYEMLQKHSSLTRSVAAKDQEFAKNFTAHQVVQDILDQVWNGSIARRNINGYQVLIYIFLPFLLFKEDIRTVQELNRMTFSNHQSKGKKHSIFTKVWCFYFQSPMVKFYLHTTGYVLFLMLFAYIAMLEKKSTTPGGLELLLIVTVFGYAANEVFQIFLREESSMNLKFQGYISSTWNKLDVLCIICFLTGLILRCIDSTLQIGHLFYAFDVSLWILRSINILYLHPVIGPWVLMIGQMFIDLLHFITILLIFLLSYGIAAKAILLPSPDNAQMFVSSIFKPYFHIMGEYFLDTPNDNNTTWFGTKVHNTYAEPICLILLGVYLLVANVLLLNLVIAIFNSTYEKILGSAFQLWRFHRYDIVLEFAYSRIVLYPPLSLIVHLFYFIKWLISTLCTLCKCRDGDTNTRYKGLARGLEMMGEDKLQQLRELEGSCLIKLIRRRKNSENKFVGIEELREDLEDQQHANKKRFEDLQKQLWNANEPNKHKINFEEMQKAMNDELQESFRVNTTMMLTKLEQFLKPNTEERKGFLEIMDCDLAENKKD